MYCLTCAHWSAYAVYTGNIFKGFDGEEGEREGVFLHT